MMVPAEAAVMTNGRPYVGLVAVTAVAVRVAKLSPSILTTRRESFGVAHETVNCLLGHLHPTPNAIVLARLSTYFVPHRQTGFFTPRSVRRWRGSCPGVGAARSPTG